VALGACAGAAVLVLPLAPGSQQNDILQAVSRVILTTDGDFNVGESSDEGMEQLIVQQREKACSSLC
jgi:Ca-activated chloride channel family protein